MGKKRAETLASMVPVIKERRYANWPRRWLNEYHFGNRHAQVGTKGSCATLKSARRQANHACDMEFCTVVRIFDRMRGEYVFTYKASPHGTIRHPGYVR
jgi:hypothetical protein